MQEIILGIFVCIGIALITLPNHTLYYTMYMAADAKQYPEDYYYQDWDRYSWFLYQDGKYDEALDANFLTKKSALNAMTVPAAKKLSSADSSILQVIEENRQRIEERNWESYTSLLHH